MADTQPLPAVVIESDDMFGSPRNEDELIADRRSKDESVEVSSSTASTTPLILPTSLRIPISGLMPLFSLGVSFVVIAVIFGALVLSIDKSVSAFAPIFTDDVTNRTAFVVQQHFDYIQKISTITNMAATDYFFDNFWNYSFRVEWFGRYTKRGVHTTVALENGYLGFTVSPWGIPNATRFPTKPGLCLLQNEDPRWTYVDVGYYYLDTFQPLDAVTPFVSDASIGGFNISVRPFYPQFRARRRWATPFISVLTSSAAYAAGGPLYRTINGTRVLYATYMHAFFSLDVIAYLKSLVILKTGVVMLIDRSLKFYIGGNIGDATTMKLPSGATVLTPMANLTDPRVVNLVHTIQNRNTLMNCASPCKFVFDASTGILASRDGWTSRFLNDFVLVNVVSVNDTYGLDLRLVVLISSHDFYTDIRRGALIGELCAVGAALVLAFATFLVVKRVLRPFNDTYLAIVTVTSYCLGHGGSPNPGSDALAAKMVASCRKHSAWSSIAEVDMIERFVERLVKEMMTVVSFIPESVKHDAGHLSKRDASESQNSISALAISASELRKSQASSSPSVSLSSLLRESIVTYVCGDLCGFNKLKDALFPKALQELHAKYVAVLLTAVNAHGGALDSFFGDHVYIHFNATKRLKGHATAAARMVLEARKRCNANGVGSVAFGIATTKAWCGMMGSQKCLAYAVLGSCVHQAFLLCWGAKLDQRSIYVARSTAQLILKAEECEFGVQHVRAAVLPGESALGLISTLVPRPANKSSDWGDIIEASNAAYVAYAAGDWAAAANLAVDARLPDSDWLTDALKSTPISEATPS